MAYSDVDWGWRSTSGYCVHLGDNLVSWSASTVVLPMFERRGRVLWYCQYCLRIIVGSITFCLNFTGRFRKQPLVYCNNVIAIYFASNLVKHQRTKHIEMEIHFVRKKMTLGHVCVLHVPYRWHFYQGLT